MTHKVIHNSDGTVSVECEGLRLAEIKELRVAVDLYSLAVAPTATVFTFLADELEQFERALDESGGVAGWRPLHVIAYYDYVSPFSYAFIPALEALNDRYEIVLDWRPFELRPPWSPLPPWWHDETQSRERWGVRRDYVQAAGLEMRAERPNFRAPSRPLMLAGEYAKEVGRFLPFLRAYSHAYFAEARDIGDWDVVREIATSVGIDPELMTASVATERHLDQLLAWRQEAEERGVFGVPAFIVGNELIWGRSPADELTRAIERHGARAVRRGTTP